METNTANFMQEQKVIKLSPEQIEERKIKLDQTQMNLEMAELNIVHVKRAIENNLPVREAKNQLVTLEKNVEVFKHNIIALKLQIEKGEM